MFVTHCEFAGVGMYIYSRWSTLTMVLVEHQTESNVAVHDNRNSERKQLFDVPQRNLHSTTSTEIICERNHIYPACLRIFEHNRGFLRQNLHPWSVVQSRTTDTSQDQTAQILAELHRHNFIGLRLPKFLWNLCWNLKSLSLEKSEMVLPLQGLLPSSQYKRICWARVYIYRCP